MNQLEEATRTNRHPNPRDQTKFATILRTIVAELDNDPGKVHSIMELHQRHHLPRRRLYDVANIFCAIGCAARIDSNEFSWHGIASILPHLMAEKAKIKITNCDISLVSLFPSENCIGLASLAMTLLLMFPAMGTFVINLKQISAFFALKQQRYKTTLCKLYQITLIFVALGIMERTTPCEVRIKAPFTQLVLDDGAANPFAIQNLLIQSTDSQTLFDRRKAEFQRVCASHAHVIT
jgi:hypothetical protein